MPEGLRTTGGTGTTEPLERCDPDCRGFGLFHSDSRGWEFQRCDECHQQTKIRDEDVVDLIDVILERLPGILVGHADDIAEARRAAGLMGWDLDRPIAQKRSVTTCPDCGALLWGEPCECADGGATPRAPEAVEERRSG